MPFNDQILKLGKSKRQALHQFFAMENRMRKNAEFAEKYKLFMSEYETLGHMEQIWEAEETGYYTPHHGVLSASKFRVVFNASAKTTTRVSLNDTQLVGEKQQPDHGVDQIANSKKWAQNYGLLSHIIYIFFVY